jgi:hypothetical protein
MYKKNVFTLMNELLKTEHMCATALGCAALMDAAPPALIGAMPHSGDICPALFESVVQKSRKRATKPIGLVLVNEGGLMRWAGWSFAEAIETMTASREAGEVLVLRTLKEEVACVYDTPQFMRNLQHLNELVDVV